MTSKDYLKLELMTFAINHDFFGYGSSCTKRSDGKYISIVDCERYEYTGKQLADEFDTIDDEEKKNIIDYYFQLKLSSKSLY